MNAEEMMKELLWIWMQPAFVKQTEQDIQKNRTAPFVFRVVDQNADPVAGVDIRVRMIRHEFNFGLTTLRFDMFDNEESQKRHDHWVATTLNQTTVHTCWRWLEPQRDQYRFNNLDTSIINANKYNLKTLAHCLFWDHHEWFRPTWVSSVVPHELYLQLWKKYIDALAIRYDGKIGAWHVINEATLKEDGNDRIIVPDGFYKAFDYVRRRLSGELGLCFYQDAFYTACNQGFRSPEFLIAHDLIARNMPVDFIALQFHVFDNRWVQPAYHPDNIRKVVELFGGLGVPVNIAEFGVYFGVDLNNPELRDYTHDPAIQDILVKNMYKFFFSLPETNGITYWQEFGKKSWNLNMIVDEEWNLRPSGQSITDLITKEWQTDIAGKTNDQGVFITPCFFGDYEVAIKNGNRKVKYNVECRQSSGRRVFLKLNNN
jgi:GH35 family endo-1,4-beta-xylanase